MESSAANTTRIGLGLLGSNGFILRSSERRLRSVSHTCSPQRADNLSFMNGGVTYGGGLPPIARLDQDANTPNDHWQNPKKALRNCVFNYNQRSTWHSG